MNAAERELAELSPDVQIRPVVGYEGIYSVTSDGRVWSHEREITQGNYIRRVRGRWLKPSPHPGGYLKICLYLDGVSQQRTIHSLVAETYVGVRPEGFEVDHIDRDKTNNLLDNLRYTSRPLNRMNTAKHNSSKGCHFCKGAWVAQMRDNGKQFHLGRFKTEAEARAARETAVRAKLLREEALQIRCPE